MKFKAIAFAAIFAFSFSVAGATTSFSAKEGIAQTEMTDGGGKKKDKKSKKKKNKKAAADNAEKSEVKSNCPAAKASGCCSKGKAKSEVKVQ